MLEKTEAGQEEAGKWGRSTDGMQDRRDTQQEGCKTEGIKSEEEMHDLTNAGEEGNKRYKSGRMQEMRDAE